MNFLNNSISNNVNISASLYKSPAVSSPYIYVSMCQSSMQNKITSNIFNLLHKSSKEIFLNIVLMEFSAQWGYIAPLQKKKKTCYFELWKTRQAARLPAERKHCEL